MSSPARPTGNILESYRSEERVLEAAHRICSAEPEAKASLAVAVFDDEGTLVGSIDGTELADRLNVFAAGRAATA